MSKIKLGLAKVGTAVAGRGKLATAAIIAVGLAIGGGVAADAAGNPQIADRSIQHIDIAVGAVGSDTVADGSLSGTDLRNNTISEAKLGYDLRQKINKVGTGVDGKDGTNGTNGKDGAPGLSGLESDGPYPGSTDLQDHPGNGANSTEKVPADSKSHAVWVQCAEGKAALGGGFRLGADQGDAVAAKIQVVASEPTQIKAGKVVYEPIAGDKAGSVEPNGWLVEVINTGTVDATVRPFVTCAKVAK